MSYPELQADTIEEIANFSSKEVKKLISGNFMIEDAGLIIPSLNGFPGPYSSYAYQTLGWQGILTLMQGFEDRHAYFKSVFILYIDGEFYQFTGECQGSITTKGRGTGGFGFDPIFIPENYNLTFSEMSDMDKNVISHRSLSVSKLIEFIKGIKT